jgi:hypothetical protein
MMDFFSIGLWAGGLALDLFQTEQSYSVLEAQREAERAGIEQTISQIRLQTEQSSLDEMIQLRKTIGQNIALNAAKGRATGIGSAFFVSKQFEKQFAKDERTRDINRLIAETNTKARGVMSELNRTEKQIGITDKLTRDIFQTIPISSAPRLFQGRPPKARKAGFGLEKASI